MFLALQGNYRLMIKRDRSFGVCLFLIVFHVRIQDHRGRPLRSVFNASSISVAPVELDVFSALLPNSSVLIHL